MGKIEIVRLSLKRGAPKEHRIPEGNTALSWAQALGHKAAEWISGEWPMTWVALTRSSCRNRDVDMAVEGFASQSFVGRAYAVPAVAVAVQRDLVRAAAVRAAVLFAEDVDEAPPAGFLEPEAHGLRGITEVVERDHGGFAELVAQYQDRWCVALQYLAVTPRELNAFLARADHARGPVHERVGVPPLRVHVDLAKAENAVVDDGHTVFFARVKPPFGSSVHCMGVRVASRSFSDRSSPMPISSPYWSIGVPGSAKSRLKAAPCAGGRCPASARGAGGYRGGRAASKARERKPRIPARAAPQ